MSHYIISVVRTCFPIVINGTQGLQVSYLGSGVVKGVNFSANGTAFIVPSDKSADLRVHAVITTADGTTTDRGAAFFHTTSSGKLSVVNDLVVNIQRPNRQYRKWYDCRLGVEMTKNP